MTKQFNYKYLDIFFCFVQRKTEGGEDISRATPPNQTTNSKTMLPTNPTKNAGPKSDTIKRGDSKNSMRQQNKPNQTLPEPNLIRV